MQKMRTPAVFHLNGSIGDGKQWVSWIHIQDWINAVKHILTLDSPQKAYNLTSPNASSNAELSNAIANALGKSWQLPIPTFSLKLLLGEASILLTGSQKVSPSNLIDDRFDFSYSDIKTACFDLLASTN